MKDQTGNLRPKRCIPANPLTPPPRRWPQHKPRFKQLNEPDVSYHGVMYTEAFGPAAFIGRARVVPLRNTGAVISAFKTFQIMQGIETLALRMDCIRDNTLAIAKYLQKHPKVNWVSDAGLPDHKDHALVKKYMGGRASGIVNFGVKGERGAGETIKCFVGSATAQPA